MLKINKLNLELLKQAKIPVVFLQFKIQNFRQDGQAWTFKQRLLLYIHRKYPKPENVGVTTVEFFRTAFSIR